MRRIDEGILNEPITAIKGIGEARSRLFNKLGIYTVYDLATYFPRNYEDRTQKKKIDDLEDGETCGFEGEICSNVSKTFLRKGMVLYKVNIKDETGIIRAAWFNQDFISKAFKMGEKYVFYGKIARKYNSFEIQNPEYERISHDKQIKKSSRIIPVYNSTANLTQNIIRNSIENCLKLVAGRFQEIIPQPMINRYNLKEINYCIENIHFPKSFEDFHNARYRLVFEEFLLFLLSLLNLKKGIQEGRQGIVFKYTEQMEEFIRSLPFELTSGQKRVLNEINADMESSRIMNRLIQGDVGSGKTAVAAIALFKAVKCGCQGALMVPTEILAQQHYNSISNMMEPFGVNVGLLTGSLSKKQKNQCIDDIQSGKIQIIIGTHALIEENVRFKKLGLVITDEQHRFGVRQREVLSKKGGNPDILVMSATPIPRTLALILYGDLDISIIDELPPGRKPVKTFSVDNSMRERVYSFIEKKVKEGKQAYIVCPLVEESDSITAKSAVEHALKIAQELKNLQTGLIHGKMKPADKDKVMKDFIDGKIDVLVSTTVIEVGVNVPNAVLMVVENAERFGLSQLHQLRGRVGRGKDESYCILFNESRSKMSRERMKVLEKTNDGFRISEKDLELRGPGDFFGTRQHGIPEFKIANIYNDMEILKQAQDAANEIFLNEGEIEEFDMKLPEILGDEFHKRIIGQKLIVN